MKILLTLLAGLIVSLNAFAQKGIPVSVPDFSVYFEFGKWTIKNEAELDKKLDIIKRSPDNHRIELTGYTDTIGTTEFNRYLADFRLNAVAEKFKSAGVEVASRTIVGESSARKLEQNRRVDVKVELFLATEIVAAVEEPEVIPEQPKMEVKPNIPTVLGIEFENGNAVIMGYSYREVDYLFFALLDHPEYNVELHGHVCCTDNYEISRLRAEAVKTALMRKGIDQNRITTFGHSNTQPLVPEVDEASQQRNRRVEAIFKEKD